MALIIIIKIKLLLTGVGMGVGIFYRHPWKGQIQHVHATV